MENKKLRVWWIPQVGMKNALYIHIKSVEEGKKILDILAAYDAFQLQNKVKGDYCNTGGVQMFDEDEQEWNDWFMETDEDFFEDVDEYCEQCKEAEELALFTKELFEQIDWKMIKQITKE